jgi:alkanesulfonate monooxygenase SsuD/methylene tetrahydromethanopterin reductase-like flavin-dependent oxidoreductase (luciferase family)
MRIGIVILPDERWSVAGRRWRQAEEFGFDHAWTYDHLGWRDLVDGPWFDAVPTLTAAAMVTRRIRLGTFVASPNFRHPVHFAREVLALDDISQGRLVLGVGAGGTGFDAAVLGEEPLSPRIRVDRFAEFLHLLGAMLTGDRVTWRGEHYAAVDARSTPGPVQRPRPPLVVAANGPRALGLAARHGDGWVTTGQPADDQETWWRSVAEAVRRFDDALAAAGRAGDKVERHLSLDSGPTFSLSGAEVFADAVGRARELGFTDVVAHWPRASSWYAGDEKVLETVATMLPSLRTPRPTPPLSRRRTLQHHPSVPVVRRVVARDHPGAPGGDAATGAPARCRAVGCPAGAAGGPGSREHARVGIPTRHRAHPAGRLTPAATT